MYISIIKVCFGPRPRVFGCFRRSWLAWLREMLLFAAYGRSSLARSRRWLEMAARARPGAAAGSKWPLEPAPEPQNTRKVPIESAPEPQNARWVPLESAPEPQNARRVPLEPPRNRRMLDGCSSSHPRGSKSAARAHSREVRSLLALEMAARKMLSPVLPFSASAFARLRFASCMLCTGSH